MTSELEAEEIDQSSKALSERHCSISERRNFSHGNIKLPYDNNENECKKDGILDPMSDEAGIEIEATGDSIHVCSPAARTARAQTVDGSVLTSVQRREMQSSRHAVEVETGTVQDNSTNVLQEYVGRQISVAESFGSGSGGGPVSEEEVTRQTSDIVKSFMASAYQRALAHEMADDHDGSGDFVDSGQEASSSHQAAVSRIGSATPSIPDLEEFNPNPLSPEAIIGRRLAIIGDEIVRKYGSELDEMADQILTNMDNPNTSSTYDAFARVARRIFENGINWGRVATLLSFGYRLTVEMALRGLNAVASMVIEVVTRFIRSERIASWIAGCGGWLNVLSYNFTDENCGPSIRERVISAAIILTPFILAYIAYLSGSK